MNIWHVYARYYNFGDHLLGVGVRNLFSKHVFPRPVYKTINTHETIFDEKLIERMNSTADYLLVGGGGLIHGLDSWMFQLPTHLVESIKIPAIVYGVGMNQFRREEMPREALRENLRIIQKHFLSFSVRNDGSYDRMRMMGLTVRDVPDPGFFVQGDHPRPPIEGEYVLIQLANDMRQSRGINSNDFIHEMKKVIQHLLQLNFKVVLCPHIRLDVPLCEEFLYLVKDERLSMWNVFDYLLDENVSKGLGYYQHAKMVIGMRGHAQIASVALRTPFITLASHDKLVGMAHHLGIHQNVVEANDPQLCLRLKTLIDNTLQHADSIREYYKYLMDKMESQTISFLKEIKDRLKL